MLYVYISICGVFIDFCIVVKLDRQVVLVSVFFWYFHFFDCVFYDVAKTALKKAKVGNVNKIWLPWYQRKSARVTSLIQDGDWEYACVFASNSGFWLLLFRSHLLEKCYYMFINKCMWYDSSTYCCHCVLFLWFLVTLTNWVMLWGQGRLKGMVSQRSCECDFWVFVGIVLHVLIRGWGGGWGMMMLITALLRANRMWTGQNPSTDWKWVYNSALQNQGFEDRKLGQVGCQVGPTGLRNFFYPSHRSPRTLALL